jgi:hypothetical protein
MDVRAFDKSLTHLQQSVQLANDFLKGYGDVHLVAPQIPIPNLQPLFSAVETAKDNIKEKWRYCPASNKDAHARSGGNSGTGAGQLCPLCSHYRQGWKVSILFYIP